jgi:hypothetical protein
MLTDSERFAFDTRRHHAFASTGNAYDASQCDEAIKHWRHPDRAGRTGGGVAMTWPFAVTEAVANSMPCQRRARARPSPISRVCSTSERPTSNTPLTLPAVWDFRSIPSAAAAASTCLRVIRAAAFAFFRAEAHRR